MPITIPDEFEVEYATNYSASYNDDIMSGSMFAAGGRTREGSHTSGSNWISRMATAQTIVRFSDFFNHQTRYNIGLSYKFSSANCPSEIYADTVVPSIFDIAAINLGKPIHSVIEATANRWVGFPARNIKLVFGYGDIFATGSDGGNPIISDNDWLQTYPFEYRYQPAQRIPVFQTPSVVATWTEQTILDMSNHVIDIQYNEIVGALAGTTNDPFRISFEFLNHVSKSQEAFPPQITGDWTGLVHNTVADFSGRISTSTLQLYISDSTGFAQPPLWYKHVFGFGDGFRNQTRFNLNSDFGIDAAFYESGSFMYLHGQGALCRGFKYGMSGLPGSQTKIVWRRGKYGQYRDMLEQRQYTKFYDVVGLKLNGNLGGTIGFQQAVVQIRFISGSNAAVTSSLSASLNPNGSGIYDQEYKARRPFVDG